MSYYPNNISKRLHDFASYYEYEDQTHFGGYERDTDLINVNYKDPDEYYGYPAWVSTRINEAWEIKFSVTPYDVYAGIEDLYCVGL